MRHFSLLFLLGVSSLYFFHTLPSLFWIGVVFCFSVLVFFLGRHYPAFKKFNYVLIFLFGFAWALLHASWQKHHLLPQALEGKTLRVEGTIVSLPEKQLRSVHFEMKAGLRMRLSWYTQDLPDLRIGDRWCLYVRLKRPHSTLNPGSFDYEQWLFEHKIQAVGYVVNNEDNHRLRSSSFYFPWEQWRQHIHDRIQYFLLGTPCAGFISALIVGERGNVSSAQWQVLQRTGTNHLIAIAGLHLGFVVGFAYALVSFLWRRIGSICLIIPTPQAAALGALLVGIGYSALAGFALPTERAVVMTAAFLFGTLTRKELPLWQAWCLSLSVILIFDPLSTLSMSFWLSFGSVGMIIYGVSARVHADTLWWKWGRIQWVVAIGLIPLTLLFFHQISLNGFIANAIAIPWVGFVVLPLCAISLFFMMCSNTLCDITLHLAERAMALLWKLLQYFSSFESLQYYAFISNAWIFIAAMIGILLLLAPRGFPGRWVGVMGLFLLVFWKPAGPLEGEAWFTLLDVGQGLSSVVQTQHHVLVYDTGAKYSDSFDMGASVVVPFLRSHRLNRVDALIISHPDNDHSGGAASVLNQLEVKTILTSTPQYYSASLAQPCFAGQAWEWDGVKFEFLYPVKEESDLDNDSSCVLRVRVGNNRILLPGDIEKFSERKLVQNVGSMLAANIIVAPHHGSRTSSSEAFVNLVHPQYVLFAVGYRNRYRFPNKNVVERYQQLSAIPLSSAEEGALLFKITPSLPIEMPERYRKQAGHYWNF